jgi:hypothetical protein
MPCFALESSLITRSRAQVSCGSCQCFFSPHVMPCHAIVRARRPAHLCLCLCRAWDTGCYVLYVASSIVTVRARHAGHASMYHCIDIHPSLVDLSMLNLLMLDLLMLDLSLLHLSMLDLSMPDLSIHRVTRSTRCRAHPAPTTISTDDDTKPIITPIAYTSSASPTCRFESQPTMSGATPLLHLLRTL